MSDSEKLEICTHIVEFVNLVHDPERHCFFKPGHKWWVANRRAATNNDELTIEEQLDLQEGSFAAAFDKYWAGSIGKPQVPWSFFRSRKLSQTLYITVGELTDESNVTPSDEGAIVKTSKHNVAIERLKLEGDGSACVQWRQCHTALR